MKKPTIKLIGYDGNAFYIIGKVCAALKEALYTEKEIEKYQIEARSGDYNDLLVTSMKWVNIT